MIVLVLVIAGRADAQCPDGRIAIAEGACCWSGQAWSGERCVVPPSCPDSLVAEGDTCVPRMLPAVVEPVRAEPAAVLDGEPAVALLDEPLEPPPVVTSIRHQLVGLGATHLAIGWTGAAVTGSIYASIGSSFGPSCRPTNGPWGWLPGLGWLIAAGGIQACTTWESTMTDWIFFGAAGALQVAGLVMVLVGVIDRRPISGRVAITGSGVTIRF